MALGERVGERINELNLTQAYVANYVGVKQPSINFLIKSDSRSSKHITKLSEVLQVSPKWLETGVDDGQDHPAIHLSPLALGLNALIESGSLTERDQVLIQSLAANLAAKNARNQ